MSRRKHIKNSVRINYIKRKFLLIEHYVVNFVVVLLFVIIFVLYNSLTNFYVYDYEMKDIQAFNIDTKGLKDIYVASKSTNIELEKLLVMYAKSNNYFAEETISDEFNGIGKNRFEENLKFTFFALDSENKQVYNAISSIKSDIKDLPFNHADFSSVMAINCFSIIKENYCTIFMEKEVSNKDIMITSITDGIIENLGYNGANGLQIVIESGNNNKFIYSNLGEINERLTIGCKINSGQILGTMGNSEQIKDMVDYKRSKLSLYIVLNKDIFGEEIFINPYPFLYLKAIEE